MIGAHSVLQGMLAGAAAGDHGVTGHGVGKGHVLPGFHITAVRHRTGQIVPHIFHGSQGDHVTHQVGHLAHIDLGGMEQCVKSLIGGKLWRHRSHQFRVHDGQNGEQAVQAAAADLLLGLLIAYYAPLIHFAAGAGSGGNTYNGQRSVGGYLALSGSTGNIVPQIPLIGCHHGHDFGRIHDAAAAQGYYKVAPIVPGCFRAGHDNRLERICAHLVKQNALYPCMSQFVLGAFQRAVFPDRFSAGDHQQGLLTGQFLLVEIVQLPSAKQNAGRCIHHIVHGKYSSFEMGKGRPPGFPGGRPFHTLIKL